MISDKNHSLISEIFKQTELHLFSCNVSILCLLESDVVLKALIVKKRLSDFM